MVSDDEIQRAAAILREGGLVAFPTETVYGLGANALDAEAVRKIFVLKGRPSTSPLIVHVVSIDAAKELAAKWPAKAEELARRFWPGPLTIVVPKRPIVPDVVTAGLDSVGLRVPRHDVALRLLAAAGVPLAAPSANRFTQVSPTRAAHVREAFGTDALMILDGGPCEVGLESTVVAVRGDEVEVLRPGMARIEAPAWNTVAAGAHLSPGLHPRHYSPRTPVLLVRNAALPAGLGVYLSLGLKANARIIPMPSDPAAYAARLYDALHEADHAGADFIAVEAVPEGSEWAAIRDRLTRAAF